METDDKTSLLARVFTASSTEESRALYDEWAKTYDSDMSLHDFTAPRLVAQAVARGLKVNHISPENPLAGLTIADAGCGTGLVGIELAKLGATDIVGLDISEGMLAVAKNTAVYDDLKTTDLTKRLDFEDGKFDALTCCGTFTHGHLGPEPLEEFVRVVKVGGLVVATVLDTFWVEKKFEEELARLEKEEKVEVVEKEIHDYRKDPGGGRILVLRKL
ncbi:Methyltransferase domain-containing [Pyrenophora seminiperda CCB06]|uniref:Methyltransferase domain-containing n=1 Tax=Pyrenophora seminiperda CCB06 TaxID=1302712 RepID=A0A3M7M6C8_9PLEO|nr:Methyltransferase domain-containing [Pyrenophora seminiperda CCB06]